MSDAGGAGEARDTPGAGAQAGRLAAWRARGDDRFDPGRFGLLEGLARRLGAQQGEARRQVEARLDGLLAAYAQDLEAARDPDGGGRRGGSRAPRAAMARGPLGALADELAAQRAQRLATSIASAPTGAATAPTAPTAQTRPAARAAGAPARTLGAARQELPELDYFRATWARLSAERRLAQAMASAPENAGPLNSHQLVHRALRLMRELSPGYLQRFMAQVDGLMWLEQAQAARTAALAEAAAPRKGRVKG